MIPVDFNNLPLSSSGKQLGKPSAAWEYAHADGSTAFHVCRWDNARGKLIQPLSYHGDAWAWKGPGKHRPLLYAPALAARPQCPVLLVEGEKTADAARAYLSREWETTTWSGGCNAINQSDFASLAGHPVIIWPDNDEAGIAAAAKISDILHAASVQHAIIQLPDLPPKWDLADALPDHLSADGVAVIIEKTLRDLIDPRSPPKLNGHAHDPLPPENPNIDTEVRIQCLGHRERKFYFIGSRSQTVLCLSGRDLQDMKGLRELCPDDKYWFKSYGSNTDSFDAGRVGAELIDKCYQAGIYSEANVRGRGCWMDRGRVVFHGGDRLLVDGVACKPIELKSEYIYPKLPRFFDLTETIPLTADGGKALQRIVRKIRWQNRDPLTADIFTGFLATMTIAGALKFRSHGWVSGASGAGKSWCVREVAARCVGAMAVIPEGTSTEAGIRSQLNSETFPVLFDEAEGRGPEGEAKRQMIIQMMRISTQDSRGSILKGSSGHKSHSFRVQSQFLLASIGVGLKEAADLNRCIVMNLDTPAASTKEEQEARIAEFQAIDAAVRALPDDLAEQILTRMLPLVQPLRDLADRLSTHFMRMLGTSTIKRVGDLLATPLAGCWFLTHDHTPTDIQLEQWLSRYNFRPWEGTQETQQADEAIELLRHLVDQYVRVEFDAGGGERTIGAMLAHIGGYDYDTRVKHEECKRVLLSLGLKYDGETRGVWMSTKHDSLDRLMRNSPYGTAYLNILKRHKDARLSEKPMWMGSKANRAIWLPINAFIGERITETAYVAPAPAHTTLLNPDRTTFADVPPGHPDYYEPGADG